MIGHVVSYVYPLSPYFSFVLGGFFERYFVGFGIMVVLSLIFPLAKITNKGVRSYQLLSWLPCLLIVALAVNAFIVVGVGLLDYRDFNDTFAFVEEYVRGNRGVLFEDFWSLAGGLVILAIPILCDVRLVSFFRLDVILHEDKGRNICALLGFLLLGGLLYLNKSHVPLFPVDIGFQYSSLGSGEKFLAFAVYCLLEPLFSEIWLRGYWYCGLRERFGQTFAMVIVSILAGLGTIYSSFWLSVLIFGFAFCFIFDITRSLWTTAIYRMLFSLVWFVSATR